GAGFLTTCRYGPAIAGSAYDQTGLVLGPKSEVTAEPRGISRLSAASTQRSNFMKTLPTSTSFGALQRVTCWRPRSACTNRNPRPSSASSTARLRISHPGIASSTVHTRAAYALCPGHDGRLYLRDDRRGVVLGADLLDVVVAPAGRLRACARHRSP